MRDALAVTSSLLLGMGILMLGAGLQGTLSGVRATLEGFPTLVTGSIMACYYIGYVGGSLVAPSFVHRVGHIRVFAALTSVASVAILLQGVFVAPWSWMILRSASGFCFAGIYVVAESWLNDRAENRTRGALLSVYMIVLYGGLGLGQFLLELADPGGGTLFILVAVLISLAVVPMALTAQRAPDFAVPQRVSVVELFHVSPLGVVGVAVSGVAGGTVFSLGSVYAAGSGFGIRAIAVFMASSILTTVLVQLPLGRLSDRLDRRSVLAGMSVLAALAGAAALLLADAVPPAFFIAAALCGGLSMSMYSLAVAHINDHLRSQQMVAASGTLILVNGVGAVFGPVLVAAAMQWTGDEAYFSALVLAHFGFAAYALWRKARGSVILRGDKIPFVASQPQAAPTGRLAAGAAQGSKTAASADFPDGR